MPAGPPLPPSPDVSILTRRHDHKDLPVSVVAAHIVQLFETERALFEG